MELRNKRVLVVGLGRSGLSAANFLLGRGAQVTITDIQSAEELRKPISQLVQPVRLALSGHRVEDFLEADLIVLSPGVPSQLEELERASQRDIPIYSEVELAYRFLSGRFIGVTGSNGKTTTATLVGELFKKAGRSCVVAGNIGYPLIECVENADREDRTYVVELSSFQLENIDTFRCDMALVLNVSPDHQDRYDSFKKYIAAKEQIFRNQLAGDFAVLNADNSHCLEMADRRSSKVILYSRKHALEEGVFVRDSHIWMVREGEEQSLIPIHQIKLRGSHNLENILAATAVGCFSGIDHPIMIETFREFRGVEHRLELVREVGGVTFYNDSKATNLDSATQALRAFDEPLVVIMGGQDKGADFATLGPLVRAKVKQLVLLGTASEKIADSLGELVPTIRADDMPEAVKMAYENASPGNVVLLSPGCASFDMFENFEHRGRVFKEIVGGLPQKKQRVG